MEPQWDRPLAGIDEVPWAQFLGADAAPFLDALTRLAANGGNADSIADLLDDEDDSYPSGIVDEGFGYRDAAIPALVFLARIIAQPTAIVREDTIELIDRIAHGETVRAGRSGAEMDARVDALRVALIERVQHSQKKLPSARRKKWGR